VAIAIKHRGHDDAPQNEPVPSVTAKLEPSCTPPSAASQKAIQETLAQNLGNGQAALEHTRQYGVTTHDPGNAIEAMSPYMPTDYAPGNFPKLVAKANKFTGLYGITIETIDPASAAHEGVSVPGQATESSQRASSDLTQVVYDIMKMPAQYVRYAGAKNVILYSSTATTKGNARSQGFTYPQPGKPGPIYINLAKRTAEGSTAGLITYQVEQRLCEPAESDKDPSFAALSPANIYDKNARPPHAGYVSSEEPGHDKIYAKLNGEMYSDQQSADKQRFCATFSRWRKLTSKVVSPAEFSFDGVDDDKESILYNVSQPYKFQDMLTPSTPILKGKVEYVLAELNDKLPGVAQFTAARSQPLPKYNYEPFDCETKG
jgi:hypothetical protein